MTKEIQIGDKMKDGTIFAGISPDTNKPMYVTFKDVHTVMTFNKAAKYAKNLDAHGHKDWRIATNAELRVIYQNRNEGSLKGTFNSSSSEPAGWYWSSTPVNFSGAYTRRFTHGSEARVFKFADACVRCVRG